MALTLQVSLPGSETHSITLDQPRVVIGRGAHVDVRLPTRAVSEAHAVIRMEGHEVAVVDEGSTNGTRVNGVVIPRGRRKILRDGDVLGVAQYSLRVQVATAMADPPERTASLARRLLQETLRSIGGEGAPPQLILIGGRRAGFVWELPPPPKRTIVGRGEDADVMLDDRDCSRHHAEVVRDGEGVLLRDLGSKNGILLGQRVVFERRLRHGDEFTLGRTTLRFHDPMEEILRTFDGGQDEPAPPPVVETPVPPSGEHAAASTPPAPAVEATPAPEPTAAVVKAPAEPERRGFDWVIVILALVILAVSITALVMVLRSH